MLRMNDPAYPKWPEGLLTEPEAATYCGMSRTGLQSRRGKGTAPAVVVGGRAYYWREDLAGIKKLSGGRGHRAPALSPSRPAPSPGLLRRCPKPQGSSRPVEGEVTRFGEPDRSVTDRAVDGWLREKDANRFLGLNPRSGLANRRRNSTAPAYEKRGRFYWYRLDALEAFDVSLAWRKGREGLRDVEPSYSAMHSRLRSLLGPASDRVCELCDQPAAHWAYIGDPLHARVQKTGKDAGLPYSTDPIAYVPACRRHAKALDQHPARKKQPVEV